MKILHLNWQRGLSRVWLISSLVWAGYFLHHNWADVVSVTKYVFAQGELVAIAKQVQEEEIRRLRNELDDLPNTIANATEKLQQLEAGKSPGTSGALEKLLLQDTIKRTRENYEAAIRNLETSEIVIKPPPLKWMVLLFGIPVLALLVAKLMLLLISWVISGFTNSK